MAALDAPTVLANRPTWRLLDADLAGFTPRLGVRLIVFSARAEIPSGNHSTSFAHVQSAGVRECGPRSAGRPSSRTNRGS